jgi:hypothetical protein
MKPFRKSLIRPKRGLICLLPNGSVHRESATPHPCPAKACASPRMRNVSALRVKKPTGRLAETRALENPRNRPSISIHEIPQIPVDPANYRIGTEALIQMAGNGGEKPEVVTDQNTQFQEKPPSQDQIAPQRRGWTSRDIRRDIALGSWCHYCDFVRRGST